MNRLAKEFRLRGSAWPTAIAVLAAPTLLYWGYLGSPPVFDDIIMPLRVMLGAPPDVFTLRVIAHLTFWLNGLISGASMPGLRAGNLLLHLCNVLAVYFVGRSLLAAADRLSRPESRHDGLAGLAALWFALHPVAVYGVGYLVQRTILLSTLFALLAVACHLRAQAEARPRLLFLAALCYLLSAFSKEHSIMLPVWLAALSRWHHGRGKPWQREWNKYFALYGLIFVFVLWARRSIGVGALYESTTNTFVTLPEYPHLTSVATQLVMFFRYLAHWLLPFPQWMSIDIQTDLPSSVLPWWGLCGLAAFAGSIAWMLRALSSPRFESLAALVYLWSALMFCTEFWAVRLTEVTVLYRSYLWYPLGCVGILALAAPRLGELRNARARIAGIVCAALLLGLVGLAARDRLHSLSSGFLTWNDAASKNAGVKWPAAARSFNWAGLHQAEAGHRDEAFRLFSAALATNPNDVFIYCNLALFYYQAGRRDLTWPTLDRARQIDPGNSCVMQWDPYLPRR